MMTKYILIITAVYPPEPVVSARLSYDLYQALTDLGYRVKVMHPRPTRPYGFNLESCECCGEDEIVAQSFTCPQSQIIGRMRESWDFGQFCTDYIRVHHTEISCIYANAWPLFSQYAIVKSAKKFNVPCVIHIQDVYPESLTNKLYGVFGKMVHCAILPIDKYIIRNSSKIIAISEKMKTYLVRTRGITPDKVSSIANWQDENEFVDVKRRFENVGCHDKFTFMYLGNIGPVAGVDLLIDAFIRLKHVRARLVIAGSGSMKEQLQNRASAFKDIEFWNVPNGMVPEIQAHADVMILPVKKGAASSSIPSKLPAYMFSAKPIIGCVDEDSDTANAILEAECGWVIEPENVEKLVETMGMVADLDRDVLNAKSRKAISYGLAHFSKQKNLKKLVSVVEEIL